MVKHLALATGLLIAQQQQGCWRPEPTKAVYSEQRKTPFFKVLVYEQAETYASGPVSFILFQDEAGNCYITSGTDGGISAAPLSACAKAKEVMLEQK